MQIFIRRPRESEIELSVERTTTIEAIKRLVCDYLSDGTTVEAIKLIFAGEVLLDEAVLSDYDIQDGFRVFMFVRGVTRTRPTASSSSGVASSSASPHTAAPSDDSQRDSGTTEPRTSTGPSMGSNPFDALRGMFASSGATAGTSGTSAMPGLPGLEMLETPAGREALATLFDSPMMQEMFRSQIQNSPMMQQLLQSNPEVAHVLESPQYLEMVRELIRNPEMLTELQRQQDLAIDNISAMPGGTRMLERVFSEISDPLEQGLAGQDSRGPAPTLEASQSIETDAMPDLEADQGSAAAGGDAAPNPFGFPGGMSGLGGPGGFAGMGGIPGITGMTSGDQLDMLESMIDNPMFSSMMQQIASNPEMLRAMIQANPMFGGQDNPMVQSMLDNPALLSAFANPEMLRASLRLQRAMAGMSGQSTSPSRDQDSSGDSGSQQPPGMPDMSAFLRMMGEGSPFGSMFGGMRPPSGGPASAGTSGAPTMEATSGTTPSARVAPPPQSDRERWSAELGQLADMGLTDVDTNVRLLTIYGGDVNRVVAHLFGDIAR